MSLTCDTSCSFFFSDRVFYHIGSRIPKISRPSLISVRFAFGLRRPVTVLTRNNIMYRFSSVVFMDILPIAQILISTNRNCTLLRERYPRYEYNLGSRDRTRLSVAENSIFFLPFYSPFEKYHARARARTILRCSRECLGTTFG